MERILPFRYNLHVVCVVKEDGMRYYKIVAGNYIPAIGTGTGGTEITESEYNTIFSVIRSKPPRTGTTDYRLKMDLTWEEYEFPPEPEPEPDEHDKAEAYDILMGVNT